MNLGLELEIMASIIFLVYLLWASLQDIRRLLVIRYTHCIGLCAIAVQIWADRERFFSNVLVYCGVTAVLLLIGVTADRAKLYGLADNVVFTLCGLFWAVCREAAYCMEYYLLLHIISCGLLLGVQMCRHNVKGLKLRHPVPYIPYISVAFVLTNMVL